MSATAKTRRRPRAAASNGLPDIAAGAIPAEYLAPGSISAVRKLPPFLSVLRNLERRARISLDRWPADVQSAVVLRRLCQLVNIARLNPLWRDRIDGAGLTRGIQSLEEFQAIPITGKSTFQQFFTGERPGMVVPIDDGGFQVVASGGTSSGAPSETVYSMAELRDTYELAGEFLGRHMMEPLLGSSGPRWVATTLADYQMWSSGTMVGGVLQKIPGVNYIGAGPISREVFHLMMSYPGPKAIMGITQSIALLAQIADGMPQKSRESFRLALYGSGVLRNKVRADLRSVYPNIGILSYFAATQAEAIGLELEPGSNTLCGVPGLHFIEIVGPGGRWVAEGEEGELVVTRLHATEAPVLRYMIGDRVIRRADRQSGRLTTSCFEFAGRSGDFLHIDDTQYSVSRALERIAAGLRGKSILDFEQVAAEVQFLNNRETKVLRLLVACPAYRELGPYVQYRLGPEGDSRLIRDGLIQSLSVFNALEANEHALRKSGYRFELRLIDPASPELVRTAVGKVPAVVDVLAEHS